MEGDSRLGQRGAPFAFDARGYTDYPKYEAHEAAEACLV
jgi:hypothetical protein